MVNLKCNLNYFTTQSGRSYNPNLGHNLLFADPCPNPSFGMRAILHNFVKNCTVASLYFCWTFLMKQPK